MDKMMFLLSEGMKNLWRHKLTAFTAIFSTFLTIVWHQYKPNNDVNGGFNLG